MSTDKSSPAITISKGKTVQIIKRADPIIVIQGQRVLPANRRCIDLVFVIDTTGSMSDKIEGLLRTAKQFVDELAELRMSHRAAVVAFGDLTVPGDDIVASDFSANVDDIKSILVKIPRFGGGGNAGESSLEALDRAMSLPFRTDSIKAVLLITDEPALQHKLSAELIANRLVDEEILTFVVSPAEPYYKEIARRSGGYWYPISATTDFSSILEMFRSVSSKLSTVVSDVLQIGGGSVRSYLQLKPPER